uniref:DUF753 domain-containing protein n=1 Tax=Anopheles christyi TaxID=43041 RepID=A0A182K6A1_9DIPT
TVSQCLVCDSNEPGCAEGSSKYVRNCTVESETCFTSVTNGVLLRGCLSRFRKELQNCSEQEGSSCITCSTTGCNTVPWVRCAHCDNAGTESCTVRQRVSFCPLYRATDRCYEIVESASVSVSRAISKGCESTLAVKGKTCNETGNCRFIQRNSNDCIIQTPITPPMQCLICSSEDESNEECTNGTLLAQNCPQENDVCFSRLKGNTLERNCLSTLSAEEQNICIGGEDSSCITCTEPGCNTEHLLKCFQCKKSINIECIDIVISGTLESSFCPQFLPDSRCFERITRDDLERGCSQALADVCMGNNRCLACAEDGCNGNSETYLNNVSKCFRCTSTAGENEACDEVALGAEECDQLEDDCYARLQGDTLERNCLSTLPEVDQQKCRDEEDTSCYGCEGHGCNQFARIKCYSCSSLQDPRCSNTVESELSITFCHRYKPDSHCYARIVDDHIERGCEVDLEGSVGDVCEGNPMCYACYRSGCNSVEEDTLRNMARCVTCSTDQGGEECGQGAMEAEMCDKLDDICFTRVNGNNLERGCLSVLEIEEQNECRDASRGSCVTCQSPSCNNQNWLKCLLCKKSENEICSNPSPPYLEELTSYCSKYDEQSTCYARIIENDLERGCSVDLIHPEDVCKNTVACETCALDNCNGQTEDSLMSDTKCIQCSSEDKDHDCNKHLPEALQCPEKNDKCFTRVHDGTLSRSCLSFLEAIEQQKCNNPTDLSCTVCEEPGCNGNRWTKCHQCDSSVLQSCANEQSSDRDAEFCISYDPAEKCYTKIDQNHQLTRGCLSDVGSENELCVNTEACVTCRGDACNTLPESSLVHIKCQQCTSADVECVLGTIESKACPRQDDRCYTTINEDNLLERGCLSMLSVEMQETCTNERDSLCIVCSEDGCNQHRWPQCYRCKSTDLEDSCNQGPGFDLKDFCPSYQEYIFCYAAIEDGTCKLSLKEQIIRDCANRPENICDGRNRCVVCEEEGCNDIPRDVLDTVHTCYQCRSDIEDCDRIQQPAKECRERDDQCFTMVDNEFNLHRGCLSDVDLNDCMDGDRCAICSEKNCNNVAWAKCFQCSNATSAECSSKQTNIEELKYCQRYDENGGCYANLQQMIFTRGCTSELEDLSCDDPQDCVRCIGEGCNRDSLKSYFNPANCLQCHSDMHMGCIDGAAPSLACDNPDDRCFYRRASSTAIHRGCLSELIPTDQWQCQSETSISCHTCDERDCNTPVWRRCYNCMNIVDGTCSSRQTEQNSTFLEFCMKIDDVCFENNNQGDIHRGCGGHVCAQQKICLECATDACNGHSEDELQPSQCLVCDSDNPFCANGTIASSYCDYLNEPCYSLVRADGVLERGCFSQLAVSYKSMCLDGRNRSCVTCNGNSCNRDPWLQCVQCRSSLVDHYCSRETSPLESHFCPRFEHKDRCYAKDVHGLVLRGCQSDYDAMDNPCSESDQENCYTCDSDHCNLKALNGVERVQQQDAIILGVIAMIHGFDKRIKTIAPSMTSDKNTSVQSNSDKYPKVLVKSEAAQVAAVVLDENLPKCVATGSPVECVGCSCGKMIDAYSVPPT